MSDARFMSREEYAEARARALADARNGMINRAVPTAPPTQEEAHAAWHALVASRPEGAPVPIYTPPPAPFNARTASASEYRSKRDELLRAASLRALR